MRATGPTLREALVLIAIGFVISYVTCSRSDGSSAVNRTEGSTTGRRPSCAPGFTYHKWREPRRVRSLADSLADYAARVCIRCGARGFVNHHGITEAVRQ